MDKKRGFSFLEILIVMMIVSILFVVFRSSFQVKNKDIVYGQACIETLYGQVNNFLHAGLSSKSINSWGTQIFPDKYIISFQPTQQLIELKYNQQGSEHIYSSIELTGNSNIMYCSSNSYTIQLSGETYELHINKWLQENTTLQSLYLTGTSSISTWWSMFLQCDTSTWCKAMAYFESDTRTISIKKQMCLTFTGSDCSEWDN